MINTALENPSRRAVLGLAGATGLALATAGCTTEGSAPDAPKGVEGVDPVQLGEDSTGISYPKPYVGPTANRYEPFGDPARPSPWWSSRTPR